MAEERDWFAAPIDVLGLSVRVRNCMAAQSLLFMTVGELCQFSADEILAHQSFGETTIRELHERLAVHSLRLRDDKAGPCVAPRKRPRVRDERGDWSTVPVADFDPSPLAQRFLNWMGVTTIGELCQRSAKELRSKAVYEPVFRELLDVLAACGLRPK
jgi:DNA-directed RNA polymerase alpha subunit